MARKRLTRRLEPAPAFCPADGQWLTFGFLSNVFWDWVVPWKLIVENYVEKWTMNFEPRPAIVNEA